VLPVARRRQAVGLHGMDMAGVENTHLRAHGGN
jgi:hypothetical protein